MVKFDYSQLLEENLKNSFLNTEGFPFDFQSLLETQRKNWQALSEAQQLTFGSLQTVAQRQSELLSQLVQDNTAIAREVLGEGTPEEKVAKQADLVKKAYEKSATSWRELAGIMNESGNEAADIINKRISASLTEFKTALKSNGARKKAA